MALTTSKAWCRCRCLVVCGIRLGPIENNTLLFSFVGFVAAVCTHLLIRRLIWSRLWVLRTYLLGVYVVLSPAHTCVGMDAERVSNSRDEWAWYPKQYSRQSMPARQATGFFNWGLVPGDQRALQVDFDAKCKDSTTAVYTAVYNAENRANEGARGTAAEERRSSSHGKPNNQLIPNRNDDGGRKAKASPLPAAADGDHQTNVVARVDTENAILCAVVAKTPLSFHPTMMGKLTPHILTAVSCRMHNTYFEA